MQRLLLIPPTSSKPHSGMFSVFGVWRGVSGPDPFTLLTANSAWPLPRGPRTRTNSTLLWSLNQPRDILCAIRCVRLVWNEQNANQQLLSSLLTRLESGKFLKNRLRTSETKTIQHPTELEEWLQNTRTQWLLNISMLCWKFQTICNSNFLLSNLTTRNNNCR